MRIPGWILQDSSIIDIETQATSQHNVSLQRSRLRPDIMLVELTRHEQATYKNGSSQHNEEGALSTTIGDKRRKVWILEGGYCSDTNYARKYEQKTQQHQKLCHMLTQHGYEVRLLPLPLGLAGTMYKT